MKEWGPMTFGQTLDKIFWVIKENFWCLLFLGLLFIGPSLVLGIFLRPVFPVVDLSSVGSADYWTKWVEEYAMGSRMPTSTVARGMEQLLIFIQVAISTAGSVLTGAAAVFLVDDLRHGRTPEAGNLIKRAFGRFWPVLGANLLYMLMFGAGYIAYTVLMIVILISSVAARGVWLFIILIIPITLGAVVVLAYLLTRLAFGAAATSMAPVSPGISQSWKLTRGNVWRALGVVVVSTVIGYCVTSVFEVAFFFLGTLGVVLTIPFRLIEVIISCTTIAVLFFDLETRNNAGDLKVMVDHLEMMERQVMKQQPYGQQQ